MDALIKGNEANKSSKNNIKNEKHIPSLQGIHFDFIGMKPQVSSMDHEETILFESNRIRTTIDNKTLNYNFTFRS